MVGSDPLRLVRPVPGDRAPWRERAVAVSLPIDVLRRVWRAARCADARLGGRFSVHRVVLFLWSRDEHAPELIGAVRVRWCWPTRARATIHQVSWCPDRGCGEATIWRILDDLAGRSVAAVDADGRYAEAVSPNAELRAPADRHSA